ncbi:complement C5-like [Ruditapes philippinarum]|uniref:complement C5-like n=1 Tax=Ruditapes philippinarum TaxID=129788 RepID=UPI00295BF9EF|nr:complement C5-like [Ruditapes philippinarum]
MSSSGGEKMLILSFLLGILVSGVHSSGYYFVIAPNVLRFDQDESVVVSVFGERNAHVKVWLEYNGKQFSQKDVIVNDQETPAYATVKVTEDDIFTAMVQNKPRKVKLFSEWNGTQQSREIILSYHSGYLIVQTDKPIYTPLKPVKIRALALDESLKAVNGWQVGMDIISPSSLTLGRRWFNYSDTGFFENAFKLPPYPELGIWTARAYYGGQFETESHTLFEVREYVLPTFGVTVDVDVEFLLNTTKSITVKVTAKYVYGKPVQGNARLMLQLKGEDGDSDFILNMDRKTLEFDQFEGSVTEFNIKVDDILNSPLLKDKPFPSNKRLEVIAMVYENATGKEEARSHDGTIFTINPYVFKFTKSKMNFRPNYEYYLKVEVQYVNGKPASGKDLLVRMSENGEFKKEEKETTNDDGRATSIFQTAQDINKISFTVSTSDSQYESDVFEVAAYAGKNQIQVERVKTEKNTMLMRAFTNIQGDSYTGIFEVIISRGKVVFTKYMEAGTQASVEITKDLQKLVSPDARLLVFYVDKDKHELVADSIKFEVEKMCRGKGLKVTTEKTEFAPGTNNTLTVSGTPFMHVGLNIIDKALLLLNDKNVLRKNKMFETLQSHDLGCGEGSGRSGAEVFKNSGLTVLTNAVVDENDITRTTDGCKANTRKRRDGDSCLYGATETCCQGGFDLAEELLYESDNPAGMNPYASCYPRALKLTKEKKLSIKCVMAFFKSCIDELQYLITDKTSITSKSLDDESDYLEDIASLANLGIPSKTRKNFHESWLFDVLSLDVKGQKKTMLNVPDSITEWRIQAIGITKNEGMCIADPLDFKAFRNFFIQLDLPYKASRLEHFNVKATIFNYGMQGDANKVANVYLHGVPHLCYNSDPGKPSPRVKVELPPNSAQIVTFPMIPLKDGLFSVKVSAMVTEVGGPQIDVIEKKLFVVNEGIEEKITIVVCLDPMRQRDDCKNDIRVVKDFQPSRDARQFEVDLTLPNNSISQTGAATAYIQSNRIRTSTDCNKLLTEGEEREKKRQRCVGQSVDTEKASTFTL